MNLDDLVNGKVDFDSLPDAKPSTTANAEPIEPMQETRPEVPAPMPVVEEKKVMPTPNTPVLGYVTDEHGSAYAAKPIPGADMPENGVQTRQFLKDYITISLVAGAVLLVYIALPKVFGIDVPGARGAENPPVTWFKEAPIKPVVAPVAPAVQVAPVPVEVAPAPAMVAPAMEAPAQTAPIMEAPAMAPSQPEPVVSAPAPVMQTPPVPSAAQSTASIGLPPPPPPMATVEPVVKVAPPVVAKKSSQPKKAYKPAAPVHKEPQPGSLEYAEQQMRSFTSH